MKGRFVLFITVITLFSLPISAGKVIPNQETSTKGFSKTDQTLTLQINTLLEKRNFDSALVLINKRLEIESLSGSIISYHLLKAQVYKTADLYTLAANVYEYSYSIIPPSDTLSRWNVLIELLKANIRSSNYKANEYYMEQAKAFLKNDRRHEKQADLLNIRATLYKRLGNINRAVASIDSAILIHTENNALEKLILSYETKGKIYYTRRDFDEAYYYFKKATDLSQKNKLKDLYLTNKLSLGTMKLMKGDDESAIQIFKELVNIRRNMLIEDEVTATAFHNWAVANMNLYQFDECLANMDSAIVYLQGSSHYALLKSIYRKKAKVFSFYKNYELALQNERLKNAYSDSLKEKELEVYRMQTKLSSQFVTKSNREKTEQLVNQELKNQSHKYLIVFAVLFVLFSIVFFYLYKHIRKLRRFGNRALTGIKKEHYSYKELNEETNQLKEMIHSLKKDMGRAIHVFQEVFAIHSKINQDIKSQDEIAAYKSTRMNVNKAYRILKESDLLISGLETQEVDLNTRFKQRYPFLTQKDIKLCILMRLDLSNKEIASHFNIAIGSVDVAKYRLRKKLDCETITELQALLYTV